MKIRSKIGDYLSGFNPDYDLESIIKCSENKVGELTIRENRRSILNPQKYIGRRVDITPEKVSWYIDGIYLPGILFNGSDKEQYMNAAQDIVDAVIEIADAESISKNDFNQVKVIHNNFYYSNKEGVQIIVPLHELDKNLSILATNTGKAHSIIEPYKGTPQRKEHSGMREIYDAATFILVPKKQMLETVAQEPLFFGDEFAKHFKTVYDEILDKHI